MEFKFDNSIYNFEKVIRNSEYNFYESNHSFTEKITLATKGIELKLTDDIVVEGNKTDNHFGTTIWVKYQKINTQSVEYFKCVLSEIKGLTRERVEKIFEEYNFKTQSDFLKYFEGGGKIKGIGPKKIDLIKAKLETIEEENSVAELAVSLDNYNYSEKIIKKCGSLSNFFKSPYKWLSGLHIGFQKVDEIARNKLNISLDNKERNQFLVEWKFNQFNVKNSNYVNLLEFKEYLLNEVKYIHKDIDTYINENELITVEGENVYLTEIYDAEKNTPNLLMEYFENSRISENSNAFLHETFEKFINDFNNNNFTLHSTQIQAIKEIVLGTNVSLLTGGAGTGKSTVTKAIVQCLKLFGYKSMLFAPTGKAALRMTECIGLKANTIHSMIYSVEYLDGEALSRKYSTSSKNTVLIVDEASMISQDLLYKFLLASNELDRYCGFKKIIFIGDQYQLPSVGSGQVLEDMINSKCFTHVHLNKTFRQAGESLILKNANKVRYKSEIEYIKNNSEFYVSEISENKIKKIFYIFKDRHNNDIDFYKNFQIAVTTNKTKDRINELFKVPQTTDFKTKFQVGDKVINTKNDNETGIVNGDMGIVEFVTKKETTIYFYDNGARITLKNLKNIDFAYACTVHKLQGSEYKTTMFILQNNPICDHRLFYTAITRAKTNFIVLANNLNEISKVCKKSNDYLRKTNFNKRLKKTLRLVKQKGM